MPTLHADKTGEQKFPQFDVKALLHGKWDGTLMMVMVVVVEAVIRTLWV